MVAVTATDTHRTIDAVWRIESAKLIAGLTRMVKDVGLAEDLAQDALVAALERWPRSGIPDKPGAWLMATAKHRAIDLLRRGKMLERKHGDVVYELDPKAGRLDLLSAAQSLAAVLLVIYGLKKLAEDGLGWQPVVSTVLGMAIGVLFVRRQRTLADPLIDLRLFRFPAFSASLATYTLGTSPVVILATDLIVGSAPVERAGSASAISETSSELGGALGIAIFGSIGTAIYRLAMLDAVPGELPPEALEAARSTLGGAVAVAGELPEQLGAQLLGSARTAFTRAFELTAAICALVSLVTAVGVLVLLRGVRAGGGEDRE